MIGQKIVNFCIEGNNFCCIRVLTKMNMPVLISFTIKNHFQVKLWFLFHFCRLIRWCNSTFRVNSHRALLAIEIFFTTPYGAEKNNDENRFKNRRLCLHKTYFTIEKMMAMFLAIVFLTAAL